MSPVTYIERGTKQELLQALKKGRKFMRKEMKKKSGWRRIKSEFVLWMRLQYTPYIHIHSDEIFGKIQSLVEKEAGK